MNDTPTAIVVEDDLFLSEIYSDTLRGIGVSVETYYDGDSALRKIQTARPDLVVLDLNLPKVSGIEIFREMRKRTETAETWVLIVTANPMQAAELNETETDSQNLLVLAKPVSVDQLEQLARRLIFRN
jgi:two-component system phosphate regulon response regulator PhoB